MVKITLKAVKQALAKLPITIVKNTDNDSADFIVKRGRRTSGFDNKSNGEEILVALLVDKVITFDEVRSFFPERTKKLDIKTVAKDKARVMIAADVIAALKQNI